jgi:hypothetical protein
MKNSHVGLLFTESFSGDQIKKDEKGRARGTKGRGGRVKDFMWEACKIRVHLEGLGVDGKMILKWTCKKEFAGDVEWILASNCKKSSYNFEFHKMNIVSICAMSPMVHTSNISSCQKNLFQLYCGCEEFHQDRSFGFLVINVCNHGEHYETSCIYRSVPSCSLCTDRTFSVP